MNLGGGRGDGGHAAAVPGAGGGSFPRVASDDQGNQQTPQAQ